VTAPADASTAAGVAEERADPDESVLPAWFVAAFGGAVVWCAVAGGFGVVLLRFRWYDPSLVIGVASPAALASIALVIRGSARGALAGRPDHAAALAAVVLALGFGVFAGAFHSEHIFTDRDPAVYNVLGRSIARTHEIDPKVRGTVFADARAFSMRAASVGERNGRLNVGFFPMLPTLLAVAWSIGGDTGMLVFPAVLGALGLLAVYALTSRLVGPRFALIAPAVLVGAPLQLWFARDAYSELVVQGVVLGGIWCYLDAHEHRSPSRAVFAGMVVASSTFARIDALAILACVVLLIGVEWVRARGRSDDERVRRRVVSAFAAGLVVAAATAVPITHHVSRSYIGSLSSQYNRLLAALGASVIGAVVLIVVSYAWPGLGALLGRLARVARGRVVTIFGSAVVAAIAVWAYVWRPMPQSKFPPLAPGQKLTLALRHTRNLWHWSQSVRWFSEYMGVFTIVLALAGFLVLVWRALRRDSNAFAVLIVIVPFALFYVSRPTISSDQPWAMRRYLPLVIPGIAIGVAVAFTAAWLSARTRWRAPRMRFALVAVALCAALAVAIPSALASRLFLRARNQHGALGAVHELCSRAGPSAAVLVLHNGAMNLQLPQTIRSFCGVPAATPRAPDELDVVALAARAEALGEQLFVMSASQAPVHQIAPDAVVVAHVLADDAFGPERVADRRPRRRGPRPIGIWLYSVSSR
jgi:hypothetical protein